MEFVNSNKILIVHYSQRKERFPIDSPSQLWIPISALCRGYRLKTLRVRMKIEIFQRDALYLLTK